MWYRFTVIAPSFRTISSSTVSILTGFAILRERVRRDRVRSLAASLKNGALALCATTVRPSATAARIPPE